MIQWNEQQQKALDDVDKWMMGTSPVFYLAGFAGTGKTTLARHFAEKVRGYVVFAAFTGKAASVMRRHGCPDANTLHHFIYEPVDQDRERLRWLEKELREKYDQLEEEAILSLEMSIQDERDRLKGPKFTLRTDSIVRGAALVILDECSMINKFMGQDLLSFGTKVLVLGDPAQLPPVKGAGYFTNRNPDVLLSEIHRQALENPIIDFATIVRTGETVPYMDKGKARKLRKKEFDSREMLGNSQILTGKNKTRRGINTQVRQKLGFSGIYPQAGERLIVLRNDREFGILNGVICEAATDARIVEGEDFLAIDLDYEGETIKDIPLDPGPFRQYSMPAWQGYCENGFTDFTMAQMDFGYAITVHKSQGSQWENVILWDDGFGKWPGAGLLRQQWLYTAITRAEECLTIVL
jgi:exodeoxyribonuclease-5